VTGRLPALLATEWRVQRRHRIPPVLAGLTAAWTALAAAAPATAPYLLFIETATVGTTIVGALAITDHTTGVTAALTVSPARPAERVTARITPPALLGVLIAVPVMAAAQAHLYAPALTALAALALTALLLHAAAAGIAAGRRDLIDYLTTLPWPLIPLLAVPLTTATGLLDNAWCYLVPTTGALDLLRAAFGAPGRYPAPVLLAYLAAWAALAWTYAVHATARPDTGQPTPPARPARARHAHHPLAGAPRWLPFVDADLHSIARDSILLPVLLSPLLLGAALRAGYPPLATWLTHTHGIDLTPHRPVIALLTVVLHVPVIAGMIGALLVLDDHDSGTLDVIRVSPLGIRRYLAYRLTLTTTFAAAGLAAAAPLSGLVPGSAWAAVVLAIPLAPLFTLATLALASNRVEGVAAVKALGIPAYAPLAAWWLTAPTSWLLAPLPAYWVLRAWDHPAPAPIAAGLTCTGLWLTLLTRRATTRTATP
jgi:hypothetical protein